MPIITDAGHLAVRKQAKKPTLSRNHPGMCVGSQVALLNLTGTLGPLGPFSHSRTKPAPAVLPQFPTLAAALQLFSLYPPEAHAAKCFRPSGHLADKLQRTQSSGRLGGRIQNYFQLGAETLPDYPGMYALWPLGAGSAGGVSVALGGNGGSDGTSMLGH